MAKNLWCRLALSSFIALSCAAGAWARADLFSDYSLERAKQQAQKDNKLLLVDFMATWCPPCKKMESSTWTDEAVQDWIKENAIALQIDVDKDEKTSAALGITAMPTLVLFTTKDGTKEFGRQVGFTSPSELLRWLKGAKSGKSADGLGEEQSGAAGGDIWAHISKFHATLAAQQNADALTEFLWLWSNISSDDREFADMRNKMLPVEMKKFCADYPAAKSKVVEMRDAADKAGNRKDWLILNGLLDDNSRTLAWFDKAKIDPKQRDIILKNSALLEPALSANCRWTDAANVLYPNPLKLINEYYKNAQELKKPRPDTEIDKDWDPFPPMILLVYGAYVGAGRDAEAKKIADECLRLDDSPTMHLALNNMAKAMLVARDAQSKTSTPTKVVAPAKPGFKAKPGK